MNFDDELPPERPFAELFRDLITDELAADSAEAQRFFSEYPGLDELWDEHGVTAKLLNASGRIERETLLEIARSVPAPGEARIATIVQGLRPRPAEAPVAPFPKPPLWFWVIAGLGALGLIVQMLRGSSLEPELDTIDRLFRTGDVPLSAELLEPIGSLEPGAFERFTWRINVPKEADQHFVVIVFDLQDQELVRSIPLRDEPPEDVWEWRPLSAAISRMIEGDGFYWVVELWKQDEQMATSELGEVRFERRD